MKLKIILAVLIFGLQTTLQAQVLMSLIFGDKLNNEDNLFGLHMDYSFNNLSGMGESESLHAFNLGMFYTHKFSQNWQLNLEMLAKYGRGAQGLAAYDLEDPILNGYYADTEYTRKIGYLSMPVTMRYKVPKGFFVELGPQISYRLKAFDIFETTSSQGDLELEVPVKDQIKKIDLGYVAGIGMFFDKEQLNALGVRYHGGFTDILDDTAGNQRHTQWAIYTNLPIGRGKKEK